MKSSVNDSHNHNVVITHLEPDILECEVKRALSIVVVQLLSRVRLFVIPIGL